MTLDQLPAPLVPPEVDLRGLKYMPLLGGRLFGSDFDLDATDAEFRVGLRLWWAAWNQVPAGSLPREDHRIRGLAGLAENPAKWKKVRERALAGFIECSDGRLYHPIVAEQALIAWERRAEDIEVRENEAERQRRSRAERKRMFNELRDAGVTPKYDIGTTELRKLYEEKFGRSTPLPEQPVTPPVTVTGQGHVTQTVTPPVTVTVTRTATAKTGRDGTVLRADAQPPDSPRAHASAPAREDPPPEANGHVPTQAGAACRAMRQAGLQQTNPGDPRLKALLDQGATVDEFVGLVGEAIDKRITAPWPWILKTLEARRAEAAAIALAPAPSKPPEPSGRMPEYVPPPAMTPEEKAAADAKRREVVAKHRGATA